MARAFTALLISASLCSAAVARSAITQNQADQIAAYYFARYFPGVGCGGAKLPRLHGDYWESVVGIGYLGTASGIIRIHRLTGRVSYSGPYSLKPPTSADDLERWARSHGYTKT